MPCLHLVLPCPGSCSGAFYPRWSPGVVHSAEGFSCWDGLSIGAAGFLVAESEGEIQNMGITPSFFCRFRMIRERCWKTIKFLRSCHARSRRCTSLQKFFAELRQLADGEDVIQVCNEIAAPCGRTSTFDLVVICSPQEETFAAGYVARGECTHLLEHKCHEVWKVGRPGGKPARMRETGRAVRKLRPNQMGKIWPGTQSTHFELPRMEKGHQFLVPQSRSMRSRMCG